LAGLAGEDGELKPAGKKWTNAGMVLGPKRTVAWRVFDAQYFGLAQRRKRVFVVASARDGFNPAEVLFEFNGLRRDTAPGRISREATATNVEESVRAYNKQRIGEYSTEDVASTCAARDYKDATDLIVNVIPLNTMTMLGRPSDDLKPRMGSGIGLETDPSPTLTKAHSHAVAYEHAKTVYEMHAQDARVQDVGDVLPTMSATYGSGGGNIPVTYGIATMSDVAGTLDASYYKGQGSRQGGEREFVGYEMAVRRLTPTECERLQGFPDGYTQIPWRNKSAEDCPDGPRYKALGNSWAVPVVAWIGERIAKEVAK
jgi:DNA (cytosine-5)-methyltransferase 1